MKQSQLFTKTRKEAPKDELAKNAKLLIRAGYIHKNMAGVYEFLPLGLRVMNKVAAIVREEMNAVGAQEIKMTVLQDSSAWRQTGRWDDEALDVWFKSDLKTGTQIGLASTHEDPLTNMLKEFVSSYKDLPFSVYQIQAKFRNELRAKSGILRGREFLMKDLYSFSKTEEERAAFYEAMKQAYTNVFNRAGIGAQTFITVASGGAFTTEFSHEFQTLTEAGEDTIYLSEEKKIAVNKEVLNDKTLKVLGLSKDELVEKKAIEVGNIFPLGTRFSAALGLNYKDETGAQKPVVMGSYGIGISRLMGAAVEVLADENGLAWPESIAPFKVHILSFDKNEEAAKLYDELTTKGIEVLLDDRDERPGAKLQDADLIGIPHRVVVSAKTFEQGKVEYKKRGEKEATLITQEELQKALK